MKKQFLYILVALITFTSYSQEKVKYSQAKIYYSNATDLELLLKNGIAVDHGNHKKNIFIESVFSDYELEKAETLGFQTSISIDDMEKHIANRKNEIQNRNPEPCDETSGNTYETPTNFNLGSMGGFLTLDEMLQELDDMKVLYPNLITTKSPISTFSTVEGRSIHWVKISDNPTVDEDEPEILFTAIHHAREPASMQQLIFYMWYLLENYATNTEIQAIINNTEQYFVPIINVDGYRYNQTTNPNGGGFWRKNRRNNGDGSFGVDPNRNYSFHWGGASTSGPFGETYPGTGPFSEVENQAIKWFTEQHEFIMALNNHCYSELLLYPFGYAENTPTPENDLFVAISDLMVSQNNYANQLAASLYPVGGGSDDWMYGDTSTKNKIYAMTPEIGSSFWPNQSQIIPICKEMMFHNLSAAHLITNYAELKDNSDDFITSESGNFSYSIKRLGIQEPASFTVSIVPISSNIVSVGNANSHTNMDLLETINSTISFNLNASINDGDEIIYKLILNNGQFDSEKIITKIYGTPEIIFEDNGNDTANYQSTNWAITTSDFYSATSSITDSPFGNYSNNTNSIIELTDQVNLNNAISAQATFYTKWNIEASWDYVQFEISTDNGNTWVSQCGKFTNLGNQQQGIEGEPMYDGIKENWEQEVINLNDYLGEQIKFRFQLFTDGAQTRDGFYFDDFEIKVFSDANVSVLDNELLNVSVYPNPTNDLLTIKMPNIIQNTKISIYAINGQVLTQLNTKNQEISIDLSNYSKGIYFVNLTTDNSSKSIKIIKK